MPLILKAISGFYNPSADVSIGTFKYISAANVTASATIRTAAGGTLTTSWRSMDYSSYVPTGTKALLVMMDCDDNDNEWILAYYKDNSTFSTPAHAWPESAVLFNAGLGSSYVSRLGIHQMVPCTNGIFYYGEYNSNTPAWDLASVTFILIGYWI